MSWNIQTPGDYINGPLTVTGSATITGDLTVGTGAFGAGQSGGLIGNGKQVVFTNNSGSNSGWISNADNACIYSSGAGGAFAFNGHLVLQPRGSAAGAILFGTGNGAAAMAERYKIDSTGIATWSNVGGVAGTAMSLNSTGLGVGVSPTQKFVCAGPRSYFAGGGAVYGIGIGFNTTRTAADHVFFLGATDSATPDLVFSGASGAALMRLDAAGNCGIGVTPSAGGSVYYKTLELGKAGCGLFAATTALTGSELTYFSGNAVLAYNAGPEWKYGNNGAAAIYGIEDGVHKWYNATNGTAGDVFTPTPAMTLDASGILMVGTTNTIVWNTTNQGCVVSPIAIQASRSGDVSLLLNRIGSDGGIAVFARQGITTGNIAVTTTGATFNSTSDYRLKEAVQPLSGGLARVNALKPSVYKWKSNGLSGEGFLAHELAEVVPAAVNGEKDAVNEDGSINAQSIDMSRVVPILVAAIQELTARVITLENA